MSIFKKKKKKITTEEFAHNLLVFQKEMAFSFEEKFHKAVKENNIVLDLDSDTVYFEIGLMCLWAIDFVFYEDGKERVQFIKTLFNKYFEGIRQLDHDTPVEASEAVKHVYGLLQLRCKEYSEAWDNRSDGNQSVLSLKILENLGVPKDDGFNFFMMFPLIILIWHQMKAVLEYRIKFEIVE